MDGANGHDPSDDELRAYGPFVTSSDIQDLRDQVRSLTTAVHSLQSDITHSDRGLIPRLNANTRASDHLRDTLTETNSVLERLCHLLEAKPA